MTRRVAAALLLLAAVACHARKEQSAPTPETLYARGRDAVQREEFVAAKRIAADGQQRFAAQPYWRELFGILAAECAVGEKDMSGAQRILAATPQTGAALPAVRRLIVLAGTKKPDEANKLLIDADVLAARVKPDVRPEIAWRRSLQLFLLGNPEAATCARQAIASTKAPWLIADAYMYLGFIESKSKPPQYGNAIKDYNAAVTYARAAHSKMTEMRSMANLGWCYRESGDYEQALANLMPASVAAARLSNLDYQDRTLVNIAEIYVRRLEFEKALKFAQQAYPLAQQLGGSSLANSVHQLGDIEVELGHYEAAKTFNDQALAMRIAQHNAKGELYERFNQARILAGTGDPAAALEILRRVVASPVADAPMRWRAQGVEADIYAKLGQFAEAEQMYKATLATGAKARETVRDSDESSLAFERNLLGFYDNYIELLRQQGRVADALLVADLSRARTLREEVGLQSSDAVDPIKLARQKNATILFYWNGPQRSLLWTVTPRDVCVDELPPDDEIDRDADAYRAELLGRGHSLESSTLGVKLFASLVAPAKIPPSSRVIILPDAHLRLLNFETLIVPKPARHYWIDDVTVSYSPSLRVLAAAPPWHNVRDARALLVGDVPAAPPEYPKLNRAGAELASIAKYFEPSRSVILSQRAATPASYLAANPQQFQFIHFAAHAFANSGEPLKSSVILAPDAQHGVRLSGNDIVNAPLKSELVTISGCNSAGRRSYAGEGLVGLAWAFLRAGAHRVVAAQWDVSDSAAPRMMDAMYGAIHDGVAPAEALRQAKLELLHSGTIRQQPFYWGPFVLYGAE